MEKEGGNQEMELMEQIKKEQIDIKSIRKSTECQSHEWRLNRDYQFHCANCGLSLEEAYY